MAPPLVLVGTAPLLLFLLHSLDEQRVNYWCWKGGTRVQFFEHVDVESLQRQFPVRHVDLVSQGPSSF